MCGCGYSRTQKDPNRKGKFKRIKVCLKHKGKKRK